MNQARDTEKEKSGCVPLFFKKVLTVNLVHPLY